MSYRTIMSLLGAIPSIGWHSTASIHSRIRDNGREMTKRSVERSLQSIAEETDAPIEWRGGELRGQAKEWRWRKRHPLHAHAHRESTQLRSLLLQQMASQLLPPRLADELEEEAIRIRGELALQPESAAAWWVDHVVSLLPGPRRYPKDLAPGIFETVSAALWKRRQLQVEYIRRGASRWSSMTLNPLGLVQDGYMLYLVATVDPYTDPRHLGLARMRNAVDLSVPAVTIPNFDLRAHAAREFAWPYGEPERIEFWIHADRVIELRELPIAPDQQVDSKADEDGFHRVTATVALSVRLDAFLLSFGDAVHWGEDD